MRPLRALDVKPDAGQELGPRTPEAGHSCKGRHGRTVAEEPEQLADLAEHPNPIGQLRLESEADVGDDAMAVIFYFRIDEVHDAVLELEESFFAFRVYVVGNRRAAQRNRFVQHFLD